MNHPAKEDFLYCFLEEAKKLGIKHILIKRTEFVTAGNVISSGWPSIWKLPEICGLKDAGAGNHAQKQIFSQTLDGIFEEEVYNKVWSTSRKHPIPLLYNIAKNQVAGIKILTSAKQKTINFKNKKEELRKLITK